MIRTHSSAQKGWREGTQRFPRMALSGTELSTVMAPRTGNWAAVKQKDSTGILHSG